ncbi:hypothetical protein EI555_009072, partial [Monodon monoceros]
DKGSEIGVFWQTASRSPAAERHSQKKFRSVRIINSIIQSRNLVFSYQFVLRRTEATNPSTSTNRPSTESSVPICNARTTSFLGRLFRLDSQCIPLSAHCRCYGGNRCMRISIICNTQATSNANPAQPAASQPLNLAHVPGEEPPPAPNLVAQENRPMNENVQMNAQGGPVLNEEDFNRDWLDWMYTFSRAAILLSIVYFYSSFSRFIMVMGAMLLVYFRHQAGWFPFRQEGGQQQAPNNNAEVNNDVQNANNLELEEMERLMDDGLEDESGEDAGEDASAIQRPGLMASAWSFITTFFTSLIPEGPPQVAN